MLNLGILQDLFDAEKSLDKKIKSLEREKRIVEKRLQIQTLEKEIEGEKAKLEKKK